MTINKIKEFLWNRVGYYNDGKLKIGYAKLASQLNVPEKDIKEAVRQLREQNYNNKKLKDDKDKILKEFKLAGQRAKSTVYLSNNGSLTYWVTGCTHAPWQNQAMYDSVINYLQKEVNLNGLILAGDFIDANSLSMHDRGNVALPGVTLDWEYKEANKLLDLFQNELPDNIDKHYLYGNHEDRYNRIIRQVDNAKYGGALISPIEGLGLTERGYRVYTDWKNDSVALGPYLDVNHGEFCNIHTAKKTIDTYRKSVLYFHTHRFQIFMEGQVAGFNMGAGADFKAPVFGYATKAMKTSWTNASALVTVDKDGFYHVQPLLWINNKLIVNGKEY